MSYVYNTGDGWTVLVTTEPAGAEAVNVLDQAIRQIKLFIADETNGIGKLLGSTGQIKTLVIGTALPTPNAADRYWFYSTSLNGLYICSAGAFIPVFPTGGAVAGKVLTSAGAGVLPVWSKPLLSRVTFECQTTLAPSASEQVITLTQIGTHAAISLISAGQTIRLATGYTAIIKGFVQAGAVNGAAYSGYHNLKNITAGTLIQRGAGLAAGVYNISSFFDTVVENSSGANLDIQLSRLWNGSADAASATSPMGRLVFEIMPN